MPWSVTLISTPPSPGFLTHTTTRVRSGLYTTAFSSRFRTAVTSRSSSPRTLSPRTPMDARVMPRAFAFIRHRSSASATTASTGTGAGSGTGSAAWIRDSVIRSWTRNVSLAASCRIRPANRRTASSSSAASSIVSASSASAPTGVLSSWLTLATKSRRDLLRPGACRSGPRPAPGRARRRRRCRTAGPPGPRRWWSGRRSAAPAPRTRPRGSRRPCAPAGRGRRARSP